MFDINNLQNGHDELEKGIQELGEELQNFLKEIYISTDLNEEQILEKHNLLISETNRHKKALKAVKVLIKFHNKELDL